MTSVYIREADLLYPIGVEEIRRLAGALFGDLPPIEILQQLGLAEVTQVVPPAFDPATQMLREGLPRKSGLIWRQTWVVEQLPTASEVFPDLSYRQFFQALATSPYAIITQQEALDAVRTGDLPAVMQAVIDALPADQQFSTTMLVSGATTYSRSNPFVPIFGASQNMDAAAINKFWRFAEKL